MSSTVLLTHRGVEARVHERRRYGTTTYTWLSFFREDKDTGWVVDPWPCILPSATSVRAEIDMRISMEEKAITEAVK